MRWMMLCLLPMPAAAWEFSPRPICTLSHGGQMGDIIITHDASLPEYTLTITRDLPWQQTPRFEMRFIGEGMAVISTDRHTYSADGLTLTVTDRGFGNVLDGLQFYATATASNGALALTFDTRDAADAVALFRDCPADPLS